MTGERFAERTLDARIADIDHRKHLRVTGDVGTIIVRKVGDEFDVVRYGWGGGFCWRDTMHRDWVRRFVADVLEAGGEGYAGYDLFPSDLR